jgi:hypothetical protein
MRDYAGKRGPTGDIVLFYGIPLVVAGIIAGPLHVRMDETALTASITSLAIFAGLLFNLLVLAHGLLKKDPASDRTADERTLLQEVYANISYSILIALVALIVLISLAMVENDRVGLVLTVLAFFLLGNFGLTLLMVLKRTHTLLRREFRGRLP